MPGPTGSILGLEDYSQTTDSIIIFCAIMSVDHKFFSRTCLGTYFIKREADYRHNLMLAKTGVDLHKHTKD